MEIVYPNIETELISRQMHYSDLARAVGLSNMQMYRRLRGLSNWQLIEVMRVCKFFDHPDVNILFARR